MNVESPPLLQDPPRRRLRPVIALASVGFVLALAELAVLLVPSPALLSSASSFVDRRVTDGLSAGEGEGWLSERAVQLSPGGSWLWQFATPQAFRGISLQADHNDTYVLEVSDDGVGFTEAFRAGPEAQGGLRTRAGTIAARGRFVRLRAEGGDGRYSVSELQLFPDARSLWRAMLLRGGWLPQHPLDVRWAWWVLATALVLGLSTWPAPRWLNAFAAIGLGLLTLWVLEETVSTPSLAAERLNWIRGATATAAALAALRLWVRPGRAGWPTAVFAVTGPLAVLCFLNFARPQFFDAGKGQPTFLHHYDMRTYLPIAKYFDELRFDGVYAASIAALAEDRGGLDAVGSLRLRNLRTHEVQTVAQARGYIEEVRARFSPSRWADFKADADYFRRAMTDDGFVGSMNDHGGNATPVWFLGARALFGVARASDVSLWVGVAVDAALLLFGFLALGWAYGPRTALVAMTVFGAMDFYMFGNNWFGAALRHDWLALWCVGLALLKRGRFFLAGGLLAWAALIRAFPAITFATLTVPVAAALVGQRLRLGRAFSTRAFVREHAGFFRVALGAATASAVLVAASALVFGPSGWLWWAQKMAGFAGGGYLNNIAISSVIARPGVLAAAVALILLASAVALRNAPLDEAAAFGAALVGIVFAPANYYLHCFFLLAVLGAEASRWGAAAWAVLLAMCAGCYFTTLTGDLGEHFRRESWTMLFAVVALVGLRLAQSFWVPAARRAAAAAPPEVAPVSAEPAR